MKEVFNLCGIVGSVGKSQTYEFLVDCLEKLEYRGYDSCGIAVNDNQIKINKSVDGVKSLLDLTILSGNLGIAHTRWATHGKVSLENSHPHICNLKRFAVVHNGIIENYREIKDKYLSEYYFNSETDTEIIINLFSCFYDIYHDVNLTLNKLIKILVGSYSLVIIDNLNSEKIYFIKNGSPLFIGVGENFNTIASDVNCFKDVLNYVVLNDYEYGYLSKDQYSVYFAEKEVKKKEHELEITEDVYDLNGYEDYMLKEIEEQKKVIQNIMDNYYDFTLNKNLINKLKQTKKIYIIGAGTSYHAGLIGKVMLDELYNKEVYVKVASEFYYENNVDVENAFLIFISQSGETKDLLKCYERFSKADSLVITNVKNSSLDLLCTYSLYLYANKEIAVASTKAYIAQILILFIVRFNLKHDFLIVDEFNKLLDSVTDIYQQKNKFLEIANNMKHTSAFYIGKGIDYFVCLEAALKLKEVSYIHAEGLMSGELKHGSLALISEDVPVVALISDKKIETKVRNSIEEIKSRKGKVFSIVTENIGINDDIILKEVHDYLLAIIMAIPTQYIAYYTAKRLNLNVDRPRNLAKSVTVE